MGLCLMAWVSACTSLHVDVRGNRRHTASVILCTFLHVCSDKLYSFGYQTGRRTGLVLWGKLSLSGKGLDQGFLNVAEMMVLVVFLDSTVF